MEGFTLNNFLLHNVWNVLCRRRTTVAMCKTLVAMGSYIKNIQTEMINLHLGCCKNKWWKSSHFMLSWALSCYCMHCKFSFHRGYHQIRDYLLDQRIFFTTQVLLKIITMALFYSTVPLSYDSVTVSQHAHIRIPKLKQLNRTQPLFI